MTFFWHFPETVRRQLRHLPPDLKRRVRNALDDIKLKPDSGKLLSEELEGYRSYRIGKYRLIYRIKEGRLVMEAFGPRESIYERFVLELGRARIRERAAAYKLKKPRKKKPLTR